MTNADRQRAYRERKRNAEGVTDVTPPVTERNADTVTALRSRVTELEGEVARLEGPGQARQCYGKERTCPESVVARVQYVYSYTKVTFGACAAHAMRHERHAPVEEIP